MMDLPVSKGQKLPADVDRISDLPPDLIGSILSFLPTKEAVAASVLSTKWEWSWTFITRLSFIDEQPSEKTLKPSFISFVHRVLLHRKPQALDYFGVRCYKKDYTSHLVEWVSSALLVDVKEVDLSITLGDASQVLPFELSSYKKLVKLTVSGSFILDVPPSVCLPSLEVLVLSPILVPKDDFLKRLLIGCPVLEQLSFSYRRGSPGVLPQELFFFFRRLTKLELQCGFTMVVPTFVFLPSLRVLRLWGVKFLDDGSVRRLLSGCTSLQELTFSIMFSKVIHIDVPTLLKLVVLAVGFYAGSSDDRKIVLQTPSLRCLKINGLSADSCEVTDLNQLAEAHILGKCFGRRYQGISNLLTRISNVRRLHLSGPVMEVIVKSDCELPKFPNLTTLKLSLSNVVGWALLPDLLEKSPFLEILIFSIKYHGFENATWHAPQKVPYCLIHHLKVIQVDHFDGDIEKEEIIRYFIENKGVLKDLTIQCSSGSGQLWDINVTNGIQ